MTTPNAAGLARVAAVRGLADPERGTVRRATAEGAVVAVNAVTP